MRVRSANGIPGASTPDAAESAFVAQTHAAGDRGQLTLAPRLQLTSPGPRAAQALASPADFSATSGARFDVPDRTLAHLSGIVGNTRHNVTIGIADRAVDFRHPLLAAHAWTNPAEVANGLDDDGNGLRDDIHGYDFRTMQPLGSDGDGHANGAASLAVRGTPRLNAISGAVIGNVGYDPLWQSINYAIANDARVINLSLTLDDAGARTYLAGLLRDYPTRIFVLAAGNDGASVNWPELAGYPNLIVVGGSSRSGGVWRNSEGRSNTSSVNVTLAALAESVEVAGSVNDRSLTRLRSGTSFAAPQVSNTIAKMMLLCPQLTAKHIYRILCVTADYSAAWDGKSVSGGVLNASRALQLAAALELMQRGWSPGEAAARVASNSREALVLLDCFNRTPTVMAG